MVSSLGMAARKHEFCVEVDHRVLKIHESVLEYDISYLDRDRRVREAKWLTLSQRVMPVDKAVSASIRFSVSSYKTDAYRKRILASCRGLRRLVFRAAS
jgi:hypothetical protein